MNDKMIPADLVERLHDLAGKWATSAPFAIENDVGSTLDQCADELRALLPAPALPTLADMTEEERTACQWMQADIIGGDEPLVIARIDRTDWSAVILDRNGRYDEVPAGAVTPRPDLPRMEWPAGDQDADQ